MSDGNKKPFKHYLYEHYLIILSALLGTFGLSGLYIFRDSVDDFIHWQYSGWIFSGFILVIFAASIFLSNSRRKSRRSGGRVIIGAPRIKHIEYDPIEKYGVLWRFWRGNNVPGAFNYALGDAPLRSWANGPYCVECDYELEQDSKGKKWICANGHRKISIPQALRGNVKERLIKTFDAELRQQEKDEK